VWDRVAEDGRGLFVSGRVFAGTTAGRLVAAGAVDGLSIGFRTAKARRDGRLRVLSAVDLREVSLVTFPACLGARIKMASERLLSTRFGPGEGRLSRRTR